MKSSTQIGLGFCCLLVLLMVVHHLSVHGGHFGYDDMHYAGLSNLWAEGLFSTTTDHYSYRWGMIVPHGIVYWLFGVSDHSSAITPLLAVGLTLWLVWLMTDGLSLVSRLWSMAFAGLSEWVFFYSNKLMPDVLVMVFVALAGWLYFKDRFGKSKSRPITVGVFFSVSLFLGFLCKETVVLTAPVFAWLVVADLMAGRQKKFWLAATGAAVLLLVVYFGYCYLSFGQAFSRFSAIQANSYFNPCSYDQLPIEHTIRRVGYELWEVFLSTGVLVGLVLLLPALAAKRWRSWLTAEDSEGFLILMAVGLLLSGNFMTTSPTAYVPLCLDIRHYLFVVPFLGAAAGAGLNAVQRANSNRLALLAFATAVACLLWSLQRHKTEVSLVLEGLLVVLGLIVGFMSIQKRTLPRWIWLLLFIPLLVKPYFVFQRAKNSGYLNQRAMVEENLVQRAWEEVQILVTNPVEKNIDTYLCGFDTSLLRFTTFDALQTSDLQQTDSILVIMNGMTAYLSGMEWDDYPLWFREQTVPRRMYGSKGDVEWFMLNATDVLQHQQGKEEGR